MAKSDRRATGKVNANLLKKRIRASLGTGGLMCSRIIFKFNPGPVAVAMVVQN